MKTEIILDASLVSRPTTGDSLLDDLSVIDQEGSSVTPISKYKPQKAKKDIDELQEVSQDATDDWLHAIATFKREPIKASKPKGGSSIFDYLDSGGKKKKKKKKKDEKEAIDYGKEFEPEIALLRNILEEQTRFTNSLQKRYDVLESSKSAARGVGKFTTDLISQINQARSASAQLTNSIISAKKTIADLNMKERKERKSDGETGEDLGAYSSTFLNHILRQSRKDLAAYGEDTLPVDGDPNDIFENLDADLHNSGEEREDEVEKYMQYGTDVEIRAVVDKDTKEYEFEAIRKSTGEVIDDYPLPTVAKLDINPSTNMASDEYYTKYNIRWA